MKEFSESSKMSSIKEDSIVEYDLDSKTGNKTEPPTSPTDQEGVVFNIKIDSKQYEEDVRKH